VFPSGCENYYGPHSIACLVTMWEEIGCLDEGEAHPNKLKPEDLMRLNLKNLA